MKLGEYAPWGHWCNTEVGEPIRAEASFIRALKSEEGDLRLSEYFTPYDGNNYWGFAIRSVTSTVQILMS